MQKDLTVIICHPLAISDDMLQGFPQAQTPGTVLSGHYGAVPNYVVKNFQQYGFISFMRSFYTKETEEEFFKIMIEEITGWLYEKNFYKIVVFIEPQDVARLNTAIENRDEKLSLNYCMFDPEEYPEISHTKRKITVAKVPDVSECYISISDKLYTAA